MAIKINETWHGDGVSIKVIGEVNDYGRLEREVRKLLYDTAKPRGPDNNKIRDSKRRAEIETLERDIRELKQHFTKIVDDICELRDGVDWIDIETHPRFSCPVWVKVEYNNSRMTYRADYDCTRGVFIFPSFALIMVVRLVEWKPRHTGFMETSIPLEKLFDENSDEIHTNIPRSPEPSTPAPEPRELRESEVPQRTPPSLVPKAPPVSTPTPPPGRMYDV